MVAIMLGAFVSFALTAFAVTVILREFQAYAPQIAAALAFTPAVPSVRVTAGVRRPVAARQAWPAPVRLQPSRRAAA